MASLTCGCGVGSNDVKCPWHAGQSLRNTPSIIPAVFQSSPLDRLAQAILDGRVTVSTEFWTDRYDVQHATTTIDVDASDA